MKCMGKRLMQAREYLDLTQEQVARILKMSVEDIQEYERRHFIASCYLPPFLKLYKITEEDLYSEEVEILYAHINTSKLTKKDKKEVLSLIHFFNSIKRK